MKTALILSLLAACLLALAHPAYALTLAEKNAPKATIYIQGDNLTPGQRASMTQAAQWLTDSIKAATGAVLPLSDKLPDNNTPAIILTTAAAQPGLAKDLKLQTAEDAYAITVRNNNLYLIGSNPFAVRHAVAHCLRELGFRYYAPSPKWHIIPALDKVDINLNLADAPDISSRKIWYAYGQPEKNLDANYDAWVMGNRLSKGGLVQTGHSYAHIINRNTAEFDAHPEYFALLENGERDNKRAAQARKFCYSNPGLIDLVSRDRIKALEEARKSDPLQYMVSVDPSDGQGTCSCPDCVKLGTTSDRVFHLANQVAIRLRKAYPDAWVGLYAYSSHRLPPNIQLEPNVYVQVALAFNRTQYSLPQLVELWSQKVGAIGLREYYGVEAWDWGLPGRMRGAKVAYHKEWIPFYAKRKLNAINAETNANWGGQALGLYIASELMWDTTANTDTLTAAFYKDLFGPAAGPMKSLYERFESSPPLNPATLTPMCQDLQQALALAPANNPAIRARIIDMMAYMVYVDTYRRFELVSETQPTHDDVYYASLKELMNFAWRIKDRDTVHYYALARRLCNSVPLTDKRPEFNLENKNPPTIWKTGEQYTDPEILALFEATAKSLKDDQTPYTTYSRFFEPVRKIAVPGPATKLLNDTQEGLTKTRGTLTGYIVPAGQVTITLEIRPETKPVTFKVYARAQEVLFETTLSTIGQFNPVKFETPKAGEYRFELIGEATLKAAADLPLVLEASPSKPAWIDYAGPHYFYVPKGVSQIYVDADIRFSFYIPGNPARQEILPANRVPGKNYAIIDVPQGASGKLWHTDPNTRGKIAFLNIPPILLLSPTQVFLPREVAELDNLTTAK
jgi:hypothetical protein